MKKVILIVPDGEMRRFLTGDLWGHNFLVDAAASMAKAAGIVAQKGVFDIVVSTVDEREKLIRFGSRVVIISVTSLSAPPTDTPTVVALPAPFSLEAFHNAVGSAS